MFDTVRRKKYLNTKDNKFNSAAISLRWQAPPMLCRIQYALFTPGPLLAESEIWLALEQNGLE